MAASNSGGLAESSSGGSHKMAASNSGGRRRAAAAAAEDDDNGDPFPTLKGDNGGGSGGGSRGGGGGGSGRAQSGGGGAGGGAWPKAGGPNQAQAIGPLFKNADFHSEEEQAYFDETRSFILIQRSESHNINDVLLQVSYEDLKRLKNKILRLTPQIYKTVPGTTYMSYIGVGESIPDRDAHAIINTLKHKLSNSNIEHFNGFDNGGQVNQLSRQGIESVMYFSKRPNLNKLIECISEIIQSDIKLSTILDCNPRRNICQQL